MVFCEGGQSSLTYLQCWLQHLLAVTLDFASLRFFIHKWGLLQLPRWRVVGGLKKHGHKAVCMVPGTKYVCSEHRRAAVMDF